MTLATTQQNNAYILEQVVIKGDLAELSPTDRVQYYAKVCQSLGLNPLTKPFDYIKLNSKLTLYAKRECTDQLRALRGISVVLTNKEFRDDLYIVSAKATDATGRSDESTGVVSIAGFKGEFLANSLMKCETKAKRRVTLSIAGLGWLDEAEVSTIPGAETVSVDQATGEIISPKNKAIHAPTSHAQPRESSVPESETAQTVQPPKAASTLLAQLEDLVTAADLKWEQWWKPQTFGGAKNWTDWVKLCKGDEALAFARAKALLPKSAAAE